MEMKTEIITLRLSGKREFADMAVVHSKMIRLQAAIDYEESLSMGLIK
jgi:hypothetical protein